MHNAYVLTCLQDSWPEIVFEGFEPLGQCSDRKLEEEAEGWDTAEFLGQIIALLHVAQWLERWCARLVAQFRILAIWFRVS